MTKYYSTKPSYFLDFPHWLFCNQEYFLRHYESGAEKRLPTLPREEYEEYLNELDIAYRVVDGMCEIWDKEVMKKEIINLPAYVRYFDGLKRIDNHTEEWYTKETIDKAYDLKEKVYYYRDEAEAKKLKNKLLEKFPNKVGKSNSLFFLKDYKQYFNGSLGELKEFLRKVNMEIIPCCNRHNCDFVIVDMTKFPQNWYESEQYVANLIGVPTELKGRVIGTGGANIKFLAAKLGIKRINVI